MDTIDLAEEDLWQPPVSIRDYDDCYDDDITAHLDGEIRAGRLFLHNQAFCEQSGEWAGLVLDHPSYPRYPVIILERYADGYMVCSVYTHKVPGIVAWSSLAHELGTEIDLYGAIVPTDKKEETHDAL